MSKRRWKICRPGLYNLNNRSKANKAINSWNWSFHKWQYWTVSNINNAQACGHVQNIMDNLRTQLIQFTDQQKVAEQVASSWINVSIYDSTRYTIVQTLFTYLRMFKIRCVIYRSDLHNLQITRKKLKK